MSQKLRVDELHPHKKNDVFFDDISGDAWSEFLESIRTSGIIEPIVVTQDKVIVSGHQRVRACKTLGIEEIEAEVRIIDSEDEVLKQLIETNIRQRGVGNTNPVKFGRCLMELERIYGIQHGGDRKSDESSGNNSHLKTQSDLADELGMDVKTISNYKRLAQAIPEIQSLVESGRVTKTVALSLMKQLSEDEQRQLANLLPHDDSKVSNREIEFYKKRIATLERQKTRTVEVIPDDYEELKSQLASAEHEADRLEKDFQKARQKIADQAKTVDALKARLGADKTVKDADRDIRYFTDATHDYIRRYGGHIWSFEQIQNVDEGTKVDFINAIKTLDGFAQQLIKNLEGNINE